MSIDCSHTCALGNNARQTIDDHYFNEHQVMCVEDDNTLVFCCDLNYLKQEFPHEYYYQCTVEYLSIISLIFSVYFTYFIDLFSHPSVCPSSIGCFLTFFGLFAILFAFLSCLIIDSTVRTCVDLPKQCFTLPEDFVFLYYLIKQ